MTLVMFLAAIALWAILRHQQRRHAAELASESDRRGLPLPDPAPAVPALESVLTILAGIALIVPASVVLWGAFVHGDPNQWTPVWKIATAGLASGGALLILGIRSLVRLRNFPARRSAKALASF